MSHAELKDCVEILTREEVAGILRCKPSKLARGWGPPRMRNTGRRVLYHRDDVMAFIRECRPTYSDAAQTAHGGCDLSSEATSTDVLLAQQIEEKLNEKLARSERRSRRLHLARTNAGAS